MPRAETAQALTVSQGDRVEFGAGHCGDVGQSVAAGRRGEVGRSVAAGRYGDLGAGLCSAACGVSAAVTSG